VVTVVVAKVQFGVYKVVEQKVEFQVSVSEEQHCENGCKWRLIKSYLDLCMMMLVYWDDVMM